MADVSDTVRRAKQFALDRFDDFLPHLVWLLTRADERTLLDPAADSVEYERALYWVEAAIETAPERADCLTMLGLARLRLRRHADALEPLQLATAIPGQHLPAAWAVLAMAHARLGEVDQARQALERAEEASAASRVHDVGVALLREAAARLQGVTE